MPDDCIKISPKHSGQRVAVAQLDHRRRPHHEVPTHQWRHQRRSAARRSSGRQVEQDADGRRDGILRPPDWRGAGSAGRPRRRRQTERFQVEIVTHLLKISVPPTVYHSKTILSQITKVFFLLSIILIALVKEGGGGESKIAFFYNWKRTHSVLLERNLVRFQSTATHDKTNLKNECSLMSSHFRGFGVQR